MRKGKQGPALFELIKDEPSTEAESLRVPDWWSRRGSGPLPGAEPETPIQAEDSVLVDGPRLVPAPQPEKVAELDGERIRFSLTSTGAAIVLFAVLVVLLGTFELGARRGEAYGLRAGYDQGRASYTADVVGDIETARAQPPNTALVRNLLNESNGLSGPSGTAGPVAREMEDAGTEATWVRGHTYIVAQEFSAGHEQDALAAQAFLQQAGLRTKLVEVKGGGRQLITAHGYNHRDPAQKRTLDTVLERLHTRGAEYYAQGGGYRLKGYLKTLKSETW